MAVCAHRAVRLSVGSAGAFINKICLSLSLVNIPPFNTEVRQEKESSSGNFHLLSSGMCVSMCLLLLMCKQLRRLVYV